MKKPTRNLLRLGGAQPLTRAAAKLLVSAAKLLVAASCAAICANAYNSEALARGKTIKSEGPSQSNLVDRPRRPLVIALTISTLPQPTKDVAEQMEIMPFLNELYDTSNPPSPERKALLREKVQETILECYFDAVSVIAECEREQIYLETIRDNLMSKRDHNIELNNATNFIASGALNTVGSVLGFTNRLPPFPGNVNQMLSGVVSATMSTYALKQNSGGKVSMPERSTMLSELFGRPSGDRTRIPESVWRFLHCQSIEQPGLSRIQVLENNWIERKQLEPHGSKKEKSKIDLVCGVPGYHRRMSLDDLADEIAMISDVSSVSDLMVHHLRDLQRMIDSDILQ